MIREIWAAWKRWWVGEEPVRINETLDIKNWRPVESKPIDHFGGAQIITSLPEYAVDGKPRRKPWSIRKKELEAAAKQKRRQRDEYRSEA